MAVYKKMAGIDEQFFSSLTRFWIFSMTMATHGARAAAARRNAECVRGGRSAMDG